MRQQGCARLQAEAAHFLGGQHGQFGDLLGARIFVDVCVDDGHLAVRQDQDIHGAVDIDAFALAYHVIDVMQVQRYGAEGAADQSVGISLSMASVLLDTLAFSTRQLSISTGGPLARALTPPAAAPT